MTAGCTVLMVENNPDDVRLTELAFERAKIPHSLQVVTDALAATDYLKGCGRYADRQRFPLPKLILLDLGLPGMSGFDLLQSLHSHSQWKDLNVTVLSGSDCIRDVNRAYELGAKSFLVKPSELAKYAAALKETTEFWLDGKYPRSPLSFLQTPAQSTLSSFSPGAKRRI